MKPGDKVVCVDDSPCSYCDSAMNLKRNRVYCVESINARGTGFRVVGHCTCSAFCVSALFHKSHNRIERFRLLDDLKQEAKQKQQH